MGNTKQTVEYLLSECDAQASQYSGKELMYANSALELSTAIQYDIGIFESHLRIARAMTSISENEKAIEHLDICYGIAQALPDKMRCALTLNLYGVAYYNLNVISKSLNYLLDALEISESNGFIEVECKVYNNICNILSSLGDYETTVNYLHNILDKCVIKGDIVFPICIVYRNLANAYYNLSKFKEAQSYALRAIKESSNRNNLQVLCESNYISGQIHSSQNKLNDAHTYFQKALTLSEKNSNYYYMVRIRIDLCKLYCKQSLLDNAFTIIHQAYQMAFNLDYPALKRDVALSLAEICLLTKNDGMLIEALTLYKDMTHLLEKENLRRQQIFTKAQLLLFNLKKDNERLRAEVERDPLTGCLSNRTFPGRIIQSLAAYGDKGALIFLDIDNLKNVNDTYGHDAGDEFLKSFAKDLMKVMPKEALKIRIAGDEFIVFIPRAGKAEASESLDKLINTLSVPRLICNVNMPILVSAGIALYPEHSSDLMNLRKMADAAMYSAKQAGRGIYKFYNAS